MKKIFITTVCLAASLLWGTSLMAAPKSFELKSPDGRIAVDISLEGNFNYSLSQDGIRLMEPSEISMTLEDGTVYGKGARLLRSYVKNADEYIKTDFYKKDLVEDKYNELTLRFKDFDLIFRAYDDGMAYRFVSRAKTPFKVASEQATFAFPEDWNAYVPYVCQHIGTIESQFYNSFESTYSHGRLSEWKKDRISFLPLVVEAPEGKKLCITEADLLNYPGMFLINDNASSVLKGVFAPYPKEIEQGGHNKLQGIVKSREDYIARYTKGEAFPWRTVIVAGTDAELLNSDMVYKLASPKAPETDFSWVKPGKVAWEWWNDWNIRGVDFKSGINNETYMHYIDFASRNGIEYVILDEGWSVNLAADLMQVVPEIDLEKLTAYAAEKNVGLILWAGYYAFDRDMENVCRHYSEMGIKGFKVDFMDRDDQIMTDFHRRAAETAAKYGLMLDMHGTYKPTGLHRAYPNVINYEGVFGLENMKWDGVTDMVKYDVTMPFIRMVAGPLDYTQGAMINGTRSSYRANNSEPMSQGTRCRQLAEFIIFESPLCMLCDSPSNYIKEQECTDFIAAVPTVWNETRALDGKISKYAAIARRSGDVWYAGVMTDWTARDLSLDLSFLGEGDWMMEVFRDGINADRSAMDYRREIVPVPESKSLTLHLAPGGGAAIRFFRK